MTSGGLRSNVGEAASRLRALVLAAEQGAFLGNEEMLQRTLEISKPTIRQAARVLEREGLLRVRRGNSGGYFGARPDVAFIETTVATYLEVLDAKPEDLAQVATALWVQTVQQAARHGAPSIAQRFRRILTRLPEDAGFSEVQAVEHDLRRAVFALVGSSYVELLFNINANFARRKLAELPARNDGTEEHRAFVAAWRAAALLLIDALARADGEVAALAARRVRTLVTERVWPEQSAIARVS